MKLLLYTHALLWFLENERRLSETARQAIEEEDNDRIVSIVSAWEIAIKSSLGKLRLPVPFHEFFPGTIERFGFSILPLSGPHLHAVATLPLHHRDPFDRLLIAQAQAEGIAIVTSDPHFAAYGAQLIW